MLKNKIKTVGKIKVSAISKDVVGLEIGAGLAQGVPAVRLQINQQQTELLAAGFIKLDDRLPDSSAAAIGSEVLWSLPKIFQASRAAIAVTSPLATLRQSSESGEDDSNGLKLRKAFQATDNQHPPLMASMPELLAAWVAELFPEGRRPTTRSIQVSSAAALNCFMTGPVLQSTKRPALVVFCYQRRSAIALFFEGRLMLYREYPVGYMTIKESISQKMNMDIGMVDAMMNDQLIDISSVTEPLFSTLFRQIQISADYLSRRKNCEVSDFYIYGLPGGINHWTTAFKKFVGQPLHHLHPFGGISCNHKNLRLPDSFENDAPLFIAAIGAARALLEDL
ncbi:MAG: hypothetical protein PHO37_15035 [Kiritimatiellae bacterium]|nr:hypothetical protein [Kiritimatiellia bacterium]